MPLFLSLSKSEAEMRTRFLNIDYFTPNPFQTLETPTFLHLPIPNLPHHNLSTSDVLRALRFDSFLKVSLQIEQLPINAALSKFFSDVLPQNIAVDVAEFEAAVSSPTRSNELRFWKVILCIRVEIWLIRLAIGRLFIVSLILKSSFD